VVQHNQT